MASIFTKIIKGEIPCFKIAETADYFAFLDIRPLKRGHTLVIPKQEVDYLFDLDDATYLGLHVFAREVALAIEQVVPCKRMSTVVVGLEVPHCHIHLIPLDHVSDISFSNTPVAMTEAEMNALAAQIREAVAQRA
ncbi:MAG: HIT family protein [Bacteroidia bacterium]